MGQPCVYTVKPFIETSHHNSHRKENTINHLKLKFVIRYNAQTPLGHAHTANRLLFSTLAAAGL